MRILIVLFLLLFNSSCQKKSNLPNQSNRSSTLYSTWNLIKFEGGFSPTKTFTIGEINWQFKTKDSVQVSISTGVNIPSTLPLSSSGNYRIIMDTVQNNIIINADTFDYYLGIDSLTLNSNLPSDGKLLLFKKSI